MALFRLSAFFQVVPERVAFVSSSVYACVILGASPGRVVGMRQRAIDKKF